MKIRKIYQNNSIIQFLLSYIFVLIFPLLIVSFGFGTAFKIVENDIRTSMVTMLTHSVKIVENQLIEITNLALQTARNSEIQGYSNVEKDDKGYISTAISALDNFSDLMRYQSIDLLQDTYIFFQGKQLVLFDNTYYKQDIFKQYLNKWNIDYTQWQQDTINPKNRVPGFYHAGDSMEYRMPFSDLLMGNNKGVIVYRVNSDTLDKLLDFSDIYDDKLCSVMILDNKNEILWETGESKETHDFISEAMNDKEYYEYKGMGIVNVISKELGWRYVLAVPQKQALNQLSTLKNLVYFLTTVAIFLGVILSYLLALKKGKPINETLKIIASNGRENHGLMQLGEAVTSILQDHRELLETVERDKPALQKAFIHDLIQAEFKSELQLQKAAQRAEIRLENKKYLLVAFGVFSNNDIDEEDEQTLDEARIILELVEKHIREKSNIPAWFLKNTYRSAIVLFSYNNSDNIMKLILDTRQWMISTYKVETVWGIAGECNDLLFIWKVAEEAQQALNHCTNQAPIVEYTPELEDESECYFPEIAQEKLLSYIKSGHIKEMNEIIDILQCENCLKRRLSRSQFIKLNRKVSDLLIMVIPVKDSADEMIIQLNEIILQTNCSYEEYFKRLKQVCYNLCQENKSKRKQKRSILVEDIVTYINQNFRDSNLGLAQIGAEFQISEGYLSSIFKEETGINFAEYLEQIRIDAASEILKSSQHTINDTAFLVGYNSVQSFRRAFKRVKGISPKEAREG